jgi:hypothetical protein
MPRKPPKERNSTGLNRTESQQGQIRRAHRTRGSQVGQVIVATLNGAVPMLDSGEHYTIRSVAILGTNRYNMDRQSFRLRNAHSGSAETLTPLDSPYAT